MVSRIDYFISESIVTQQPLHIQALKAVLAKPCGTGVAPSRESNDPFQVRMAQSRYIVGDVGTASSA